MKQCAYRYPDNAQCIITTLPETQDMCDEHQYMTEEKDRQTCSGMMKMRKKNKGYWFIKHNGPESKYPEAMIRWINREMRQ